MISIPNGWTTLARRSASNCFEHIRDYSAKGQVINLPQQRVFLHLGILPGEFLHYCSLYAIGAWITYVRPLSGVG